MNTAAKLDGKSERIWLQQEENPIVPAGKKRSRIHLPNTQGRIRYNQMTTATTMENHPMGATPMANGGQRNLIELIQQKRPGLDRAGMESKILCTPLEAKQGCAM
jgi:hypothetical protein